MVVALAGMVAVPAVAQQPTTCPEVTLSTLSGAVGSPVTVAVNGPDTWEGYPVTVAFDGNAVATSPAAVTANENGDASCQFAVPATVGGIPHTITVTVAATQCTATFTVVPAVKISPTTGPSGTSATVTGSGFGTTVPVTAMVTVGGATFATGVAVNTDGSFTATGAIPAGLMAGPQPVVAIDGASLQATAAVPFTVTPNLAVTPTSGLAGIKVSIAGSGWADSDVVTNSDVTLTFGGQAWVTVEAPGGVIDETEVVTLTTTPAGGMAIAGSQTVNIGGVPEPEYTIAGGTTFTVVARELSLTPASGPMGTSVMVMASNLTPDGTVEIGDLDIGTKNWNGAVIPITTGGALTPTTLIVPAGLIPGANTVLLTDTPGGLQAAGIFTVTRPTLSVTPATGPENSMVTIRGSGWVPGRTVTLWFNDVVLTSAMADGNGNIAAAINIPAAAVPGANRLDATDDRGNKALTAIFTVPGAAIQVTDPDPAEGGAGSAFTITGSGFGAYTGITVRITGFGASAPYTFPTSAFSGPLGAFTFTSTIPGVAPGSAVLSATDGLSTATTFFVVTQPEETVETALASIMDNVVIVWHYDNQDAEWFFFDPLDPGSDLETLEAGGAYWIKVDLAEGVDSIELVWGVHAYTLYDGWNNIGWQG